MCEVSAVVCRDKDVMDELAFRPENSRCRIHAVDAGSV
jgi:hypothetical protein